MEKHETPRQKKIGTVLQQEIAALLQNAIRKGNVSNLMISVTKVNVTSDLSIAKIYLSIFPNNLASSYFENLKEKMYSWIYNRSRIDSLHNIAIL